jgi:pimeloyl-ACP methyl ester carboxylesterase
LIRRLGRLVLSAAWPLLIVATVLYAAAPYIERRMTFHPRTLDPRAPRQLPPGTLEVTLPAADGVRLHGWFLTATGVRNGTTVLFLHGNGALVLDHAADLVFLQKRGFDILAIDYRGYGLSEGRSLGEATLVLDGAAAWRHLTVERRIDPTDIALLGYSLGTTVAADLAIAAPCRAIAMMAPLDSAERHARRVMGLLPDFYFSRMQNRFDTVGKIGRARCPVLVVHGERDTTISIAQGRAVYEAAKPPKRMIAVPDADHWLPLNERRSYASELAAFLAGGS